MWRIFGHTWKYMTRGCRKLHDYSHDLYCSPNIKSYQIEMRFLGLVCQIDQKLALILTWSLKGKGPLRYVCMWMVDVKVGFKKWRIKAWIVFIWHTIGTCGGILWTCKRTSGFPEKRRISLTTETLFASTNGLWSRKLTDYHHCLHRTKLQPHTT
jgi:hypothetical protein